MSNHFNKKRDQKLDIKDLNQKQKQKLEEESERYDHFQIDEKNQDFLQEAKQRRKLHRRHRENKDLEGESDIDEEFKIGLTDAAGKFGQKRKKKYMFNDAGMPIEPFNLENDIKEGNLTREGVFKLNREKKYEDDDLKDAWYDSVKDQQAKMLYNKSQNQHDSDANESDDDEGNMTEEREDDEGQDPQNLNPQEQRNVENEIETLKKDLLNYLNEEKNENANMALKRLRDDQQRQNQQATKKKNVRTKDKQNSSETNNDIRIKEDRKEEGNENPQSTTASNQQITPTTGNSSTMSDFQKLIAITTRLQDLGYTDVFTDKREDIQYEIQQAELQRQREKLQKEKEEKGWYYKIMNKQDGSESEAYGPFTQDEMIAWNDGGYFKETDDQFCTFIKASNYLNKQDNWIFIEDCQFKY